jgi:hypothetical protein
MLRSLRKHYNGNLTVFLEGYHDPKLVSGIKDSFNANVVYREVSPSQHRALLRKIEICLDSPYDLSVVLDSDIIVTGDFSELFEAAKDHDLVLAHFAGWDSNGPTISRRIRGYAPLKPEYIDAAVNYGPAINCGVFAWHKGSVMFKEWLEIASWGEKQEIYICDEVACQLLLPRYNVKVLGTRCNVSVLHDPGTTDPRIIHFHGKKHVLNEPKCALWLKEFIEALKENTCEIKSFIEGSGDRRLNKFIHGNEPTMHAELKAQVKEALGMQPVASTCPGFKDDEVTIVTACDPKYIQHLRVTLPNWVKHKHVDRFGMIVYVNGFRRPRRNKELDFLRAYPNIRIIPWDFPVDTQREKMLTAFVLGAAKDVNTPYWVKMDADAFAFDDEPLITPVMKDFAICGHRWGYSFAKHMQPLIDWANDHPAFKDTPKDAIDPKNVDGKRYYQPRVASYVMFHKSEFVRMAAEMAGDRLPVPSHDTYLWYVANRLGLPIFRHNFKRNRGMSNKSDYEALKGIVKEIDPESGTVTTQTYKEEEDAEESND